MPRRRAVRGGSGLLAVLVPVAVTLLPVPYVLLSPGPITDTLGEAGGRPLIRVEGRPTFPTEGHLYLTTVGVTGTPERDITLARALVAWLDDESAVVPRAAVFPPNESAQQVERRNNEDMQASQQDAAAAALRALRLPVEAVEVRLVSTGAPAEGRLRVGDAILAVDGKPVGTAQDVRAAVSAHAPGEEVVVRVRREGRELDQAIRTGERVVEGGRRVAVIGIVPTERYPVAVDIRAVDDRGRDIGGPSAGLMFALGLYDKLTPGSLTGGRSVAGTGTISPDGRVGPIGGIQQKLAAARDRGAEVFLTPAGNCEDAVRAVPEGLRLAKVGTFEEGLTALDAVRTGREDLPSC